ncbi:hypothetical protein C1Y08_24360 [Pseudomonas sp. FW306-02-F02-AA]|uniref:Uncharacterized protein n=1 Tax=Pseudomonas fluorescens TaxID=294 RepID=A0A0N9WUH9_PSEFL|nr:hypothetical protein AO353_11455 [Pseudomonas fluorescens]PMZ01711.1 hypothetical protein C1Y07_23800 [Pseudomonas sp. FW306-02-F02-AB]PMZ07606.1 hypothetical protein C1Y06_23755 [Pseudomonas sp. FW306-02-H06C]PMZ13324.1 hypothetical protein C1Y08_24360 [Pseudomonas sp. FW306-02-F02-AA]PMZ19368.1 hypothetical protein C1Y09_24425 [Pseudomonas sp. FW306-02-F08-AA]PMZ29336.1 hypothetical protein C1Y05_01935 [Pseudomonas sp. FW306-02-F04-BA]PMZ31901.1 hypothetical protein C1X99_24130 [Pseudomo
MEFIYQNGIFSLKVDPKAKLKTGIEFSRFESVMNGMSSTPSSGLGLSTSYIGMCGGIMVVMGVMKLPQLFLNISILSSKMVWLIKPF